MNPIASLAPTTLLPPALPAATAAAPPQSFKDILLDALQQVNQMQHDADLTVQQLGVGANVSSAELLGSLKKADLSLTLMLQMQSKLVQALGDLNNIRI
ncbi:MAG TPA: flagellar hook-basal body complex protein FliE [Pirellulaceae bacterium]|nr:flagellar hook-basal body complex protein FliE [Pirellulaceae bacterium]